MGAYKDIHGLWLDWITDSGENSFEALLFPYYFDFLVKTLHWNAYRFKESIDGSNFPGKK